MLIKNKIKGVIKKFFEFLGIGTLVAGSWIFYIFNFLIVASTGLLMIYWAIKMFLEGSIIIGLLVLLIGTPIMVGIAQQFSVFYFLFMVIALILWAIINLFGLDISFGSVFDSTWLIIRLIGFIYLLWYVVFGLYEAIKRNELLEFLKDNWYLILFFLFVIWLLCF